MAYGPLSTSADADYISGDWIWRSTPADAGCSSGERIWRTNLLMQVTVAGTGFGKKTPADDQQVAAAGRGFGDRLLMQDTHHVYWGYIGIMEKHMETIRIMNIGVI